MLFALVLGLYYGGLPALLVEHSGFPAAPAVWIMAAAVTLLTLLLTRETHRRTVTASGG